MKNKRFCSHCREWLDGKEFYTTYGTYYCKDCQRECVSMRQFMCKWMGREDELLIKIRKLQKVHKHLLEYQAKVNQR